MIEKLREVGNSHAVICMTPTTPEQAPPEVFEAARDGVMKHRKSMLTRLAQ